MLKTDLKRFFEIIRKFSSYKKEIKYIFSDSFKLLVD